MPYLHFIEKLIGLQGFVIKNVSKVKNITLLDGEIKRNPHKCPCCNHITNKVHDYRKQRIKDIPAFGKHVILKLRKRRYVCDKCGKRFYENVDFLPKYHRMTSRLITHILDKLQYEYSFTSVAREVNLSVTTVIRVFDLINYPKPNKLPKVLAIDEFKGNTGGQKFQCILTDPASGRVLDILPERNQEVLIDYFKQWNQKSRKRVKYFVSDMWKPYTDFASAFFKNATQIIDRYHFIRQSVICFANPHCVCPHIFAVLMLWAFDKVRKRIQKVYGKEYRKLFKNSRLLLIMCKEKLKDWQKEKVEALLYVSDELLHAYYLKELFYQMIDSEDRETAKTLMSDWIYSAQDSKIDEYVSCANTMFNWQTGILNSFDVPYSNGFTEGCNNKIKVLKRNAYGFHNYRRFRNRILHMFHYKHELAEVSIKVA